MINSSSQSPLTLSREDLYELVWSKPMLELAKDFGISDVALAKRCRRLRIPAPGRGYWARVAAGQTPHRAKLPEREPKVMDYSALTVPAPASGADSGDGGGPLSTLEERVGEESANAQRRADAVWLAERIAFEGRPESAIEVSDPVRTWDPVVRVHRDRLEAAAKEMRASKKAAERYEKLPAARQRFESRKETWKWDWSKDRGQRLCDTHKPTVFRVSLGTYERAIRITNAIAMAGKTRGFAIRDDPEQGRIALVGNQTEVLMRITEQLEERVRKRVRYDGKTEPESYKVPTGRLRISLQIGYGEAPKLEDKGPQQLESMLNRLFVAVYRMVVKCWERVRARVASERRYAEEARRRAEAERIRAEQERKAAEECRRREALASEARHWADARAIREYLAHLSAAAGADRTIGNWLEWAQVVADELDPTAVRLGKRRDSSEDGFP